MSEETSEEEDLRAELERLRRENEALKRKTERGISLKVSAKGAVSLYGLAMRVVTERRPHRLHPARVGRPDREVPPGRAALRRSALHAPPQGMEEAS